MGQANCIAWRQMQNELLHVSQLQRGKSPVTLCQSCRKLREIVCPLSLSHCISILLSACTCVWGVCVGAGGELQVQTGSADCELSDSASIYVPQRLFLLSPSLSFAVPLPVYLSGSLLPSLSLPPSLSFICSNL